MSRVPIHYDGSRGAIRVQLRNPLTALDLPDAGVRSVLPGDAEDLLSPKIGGAFSRTLPLSDAAVRFTIKARVLTRLADKGELTTALYTPPGTEQELRYLVLDRLTLKRLATAAAAGDTKEDDSK